MPKYVRTKDGIYEVVEDNNKEWGKQIVVKFPKNLNMKLADVKDQIIKQSDNLDELCDCFVTEGNRHIVWDKQQNKGITFEQVKDSFASYHFKIFGAVWCDKGLIYVAKMNKDGVLCLI